jgi:hypothetical protein
MSTDYMDCAICEVASSTVIAYNSALKYEVWYPPKFIYSIVQLEIAFMKLSYAIMIFDIMLFDIMLFEFIRRETVIIEISFGMKQSFGMSLRNQNSTSGSAWHSETKTRLPV